MTRNQKIAAWTGGVVLGLMAIGAALPDEQTGTASSGPAISWEDPTPAPASTLDDTMALVNEATVLVREVSALASTYAGTDEASICNVALPQIETKMARLSEIMPELGSLPDVDVGTESTIRESYDSMQASFATVSEICG